MASLETILESFPNVSSEAITAFKAKFEPITFQKGDLLEKEGQISNYLYFIEDGAARSYYIRDKRDITISFSLESELLQKERET